jgi:sec-independent protein translocase protein TatC
MSPSNESESLQEGTLISHLLELRSRLLKALLSVVIVSIPCLIYGNELFTFVAEPLRKVMPKGSNMIAINLMAPLVIPFKLAFYVAALLAMPFVLYQIWAFVAPGLYRHERRLALPLLISSVILFYLGLLFAYAIVFPAMFAFLTATSPPGVQIMTDMTQYLDFILVMFLGFGLAFEIPVAIVLLVAMGAVEIKTLTGNRGYVLIFAFLQAAVLTPPDVVSMTLMAVPMYLLYEFGIIMAKLMARHRQNLNDSVSPDNAQ